jgi:hypothetical protein
MQLDLRERQAAYESLGDDATRTRIGKASYLLATREQLNTVPEPCRLTRAPTLDLTLIGRDVRFLARRRLANFSNPSVIEDLLLLQ